jgi:uncharacterized protein involved in outer membrane biogenesis
VGAKRWRALNSLYFNVESSSLFRGGPVISELKLVGPAVKVVRLADGRFNFSDLIDEFMARPAVGRPDTPFSLNNIQISGGKIEFDDRMLGEKHLISESTLPCPFISSLPHATEIFVEPAFSASIDGSPLVVQGKSKPFATSMESELALRSARRATRQVSSITCRSLARSRSFRGPSTAI